MDIKNKEDLSIITTDERNLLEIALGVLRSQSDWADFLASWLADYGRRILLGELEPLVPEELNQTDTVASESLFYIN